MTTMRVLLSCSRTGMLKRVRMLMTGMTLPRRLMTPSMKAGARGTMVICIRRMISCTAQDIHAEFLFADAESDQLDQVAVVLVVSLAFHIFYNLTHGKTSSGAVRDTPPVMCGTAERSGIAGGMAALTLSVCPPRCSCLS